MYFVQCKLKANQDLLLYIWSFFRFDGLDLEPNIFWVIVVLEDTGRQSHNPDYLRFSFKIVTSFHNDFSHFDEIHSSRHTQASSQHNIPIIVFHYWGGVLWVTRLALLSQIISKELIWPKEALPAYIILLQVVFSILQFGSKVSLLQKIKFSLVFNLCPFPSSVIVIVYFETTISYLAKSLMSW